MRTMDYLLTLKFVSMFRSLRNSIETLEVFGPQLSASDVGSPVIQDYQQRQPPYLLTIFLELN